MGAGPERAFARTMMLNDFLGFLGEEEIPYEILELMAREKRSMSPFPEELHQTGGPAFFPHPDRLQLFFSLIQAGVPREDIRMVPGGLLVSARSMQKAGNAFLRLQTGLEGET